MFLSMFRGRLKRNLNLWSTLSAFLVESALSFRPSTSWNNVSAVLLAPVEDKARAAHAGHHTGAALAHVCAQHARSDVGCVPSLVLG